MGTEESNTFGTPYKLLMPQYGTLNKPLPPHWTPPMQPFDNSGSTSTSLLNPHVAGSYFCNYTLPKQANGTSLQYGFLHDPTRLSNNPIVAREAALVFSEKLGRTFGENNLDSMKKCDANLQSVTLKFRESIKNGNRFSFPKNDKDGVSLSATSGSKESPGEGHDTNNGFPSTKKQKCTVMLGNANSAEQNQNLGTCLNATTGSNPQFSKLDEDEVRKERKRQSNRESAKRSRMRKQKECEELHRNMVILKDENSELTNMLMRLSEECLGLTTENDCIQEELVEMYGPESIADLLPMKPASGGSQTTVKDES